MTVNLRIGIPEVVATVTLLFIAALVVLFIIEWPIGLVPAATYAVASAGAYAGYSQHARERRKAEAAERVQRFRVVDTRGVCPLGRKAGETISVVAGGVTPAVCEEARNVLSMAAASPDGSAARDWCCPVYDHMLVFRREREKAAA